MTASTTNERALRALTLTAALLAVSGCADDARPPFAGGGDGTDAGASSGGASAAGTSSGGSAGDGAGGTAGGVGGAASAGSSGGDGFETVPEPDVPSLCAESMAAGAPVKLEMSTAAADVFAGITDDERVLAWMTFDGGVSTLYTASRDDAAGAFETPVAQVVETPDPVAIGREGYEIVLVDADRGGFSVMRRAALDEPFESVSTGAFSALFEAEDPATRYADPVLSGDDLALYYSRLGARGERELLVSRRISPFGSWAPATAVPLDDAMETSGSGRLRVTGVSRDGRTLFLWNDARSVALAAILDRESLTFGEAAELGPLSRATPNADCSRLYHSSGADLFVSSLR